MVAHFACKDGIIEYHEYSTEHKVNFFAKSTKTGYVIDFAVTFERNLEVNSILYQKRNEALIIEISTCYRNKRKNQSPNCLTIYCKLG